MASDPNFPEHLMPVEEPEALKDIEITEAHRVYARQRWPDASQPMQDYRMRQSIWVRFQKNKPHPDDPNRRLMGGPQPGSGRKRMAIGKAIVDHFETRTKEVLDAIAAPLDSSSGSTPMERHKAGMNIAEHARREAKEQREADAWARLTDDEVRKSAAEEFAKMLGSGEVSLADLMSLANTDTVDGEAELVEIEQG